MHRKIKPNTPRIASGPKVVSTQNLRIINMLIKNYLNLEILSEKTNPYASSWKKKYIQAVQ